MCEKWTQHPPEHKGACGGKEKPNTMSFMFEYRVQYLCFLFLTDPNLSHETRNKGEMSFDSQRLTAFLRSASQVVFSHLKIKILVGLPTSLFVCCLHN